MERFAARRGITFPSSSRGPTRIERLPALPKAARESRASVFPLVSKASFQDVQGLHEEVFRPEVAGLQRERQARRSACQARRDAGIDLRPDLQGLDAEALNDRTGSLTPGHHQPANAAFDQALRDARERLLDQLTRPRAAELLLNGVHFLRR